LEANGSDYMVSQHRVADSDVSTVGSVFGHDG
jgi:hypothetical protein